MSERKSEPAFPHDNQELGDRHRVAHPGMALRDYFAAHAIAEVVRIYAADNKCGIGVDHLPRNCAAHAYRIADAMLAERDKT